MADATLTWNTAIVEIDKFFLINLGKSDKEIESILAAGTLTLFHFISKIKQRLQMIGIVWVLHLPQLNENSQRQQRILRKR